MTITVFLEPASPAGQAQAQNPPTAPIAGGVANHFSVHQLDNPTLLLLIELLSNTNFNTWKRAMMMTLSVKNKIGFIQILHNLNQILRC